MPKGSAIFSSKLDWNGTRNISRLFRSCVRRVDCEHFDVYEAVVDTSFGLSKVQGQWTSHANMVAASDKAGYKVRKHIFIINDLDFICFLISGPGNHSKPSEECTSQSTEGRPRQAWA